MTTAPGTVLEGACVLVSRDASPSPEVLTVSNRAHGGVCLPGGKREPEDASVEVTAIRELYEETNLQVDLSYLVHLCALPSVVPPTRLVHLYYARLVRGTARDLEAGTHCHWLRWTELLAASHFAAYYLQAAPRVEQAYRLYGCTAGTS